MKDVVFVSPQFLFPVDSGGKIRTTQILRGLKESGAYRIHLLSPAPQVGAGDFSADLDAVCHEFTGWKLPHRGEAFKYTRMRHLAHHWPIPVVTDWSADAQAVVSTRLSAGADLAVFDFPHAAIFLTEQNTVPTLMFTHNVEAEIFERHEKVAGNPVSRFIWANQSRKMRAYEQQVLTAFDHVVAVSNRDRDILQQRYGVDPITVIPTGVDLDDFAFHPPSPNGRVVFTGSMDWLANIDGIEFLMDEVWEQVVAERPLASMTVIGRSPPPTLVERAKQRSLAWTFTGYVDDVKPHCEGANAYVIPLRVGGGTRLKVYEAMAMGCPMVATTIAVEGLPIEDGTHYLRADTAEELVACLVRVLSDESLCRRLAESARNYVAEHFSYRNAALKFAEAMEAAIATGRRG